MKITAHIDGSCGPKNPGGKMGIGVTVKIGSGELKRYSNSVEENPNNSSNWAEYLALEYLLRMLRDYKNSDVEIFSDSQLLVYQMSMVWKIKRGAYVDAARDCLKEIVRLESENALLFYIRWVPRHLNGTADILSKM